MADGEHPKWMTYCAPVLEPGDPPRSSTFAFWDPAGGTPGDGGGEATELTVVTATNGNARRETVTARRMPVSDTLAFFLRARSVADVHPATAFWAAATVAALHLAGQGRLLPGLSPGGADAWRVGPLQVDDVRHVRALAAAMPVAARAVPLDTGDGPVMLPDAEALVRAYFDAVADLLPRTPAAAWLAGGDPYAVAQPQQVPQLGPWAQSVALGVDTGVGVALRLETAGPDPGQDPFRAVVRLRSLADPTVVADVTDVFTHAATGFDEHARIDAVRAVRKAAAAWPVLERLLEKSVPDVLDLFDDEVHDLLGGAAARLGAAGVDVEWPTALSQELSVRAVVSAGPHQPSDVAAFFADAQALPLSWQLVLADEPLGDEEHHQVGKQQRPVVRLRDRWVLVPPETARRARDREMAALPPFEALRRLLIGQTTVADEVVPVVATGWLGELVAAIRDPDGGPEPLAAPDGLKATLRDYQLRGLRWLDRMSRLRLGGCLADDMGLGKTLMLIALHLRRQADPATAGTTLVVCPASLLSNWEREISRFAPGTPVYRFHGPGRRLAAVDGGVVLTTYATMRMDADLLAGHPWRLLVADEAQHVKNRLSDTARALRRIPADVRLALTGTPVENNVSELWAILDWSTPGLLGTAREFRAEWGRPAESTADRETGRLLARIVRPFVLRRRKTDPGILSELPPKTETDQFVSLTPEQASLYTSAVADIMGEIRGSGPGIARHGLILKLLTALKQICNHPAHYLRDADGVLTGRSGKLALLDELVDTIQSEGGAALVFTQYVQMARLLQRHLSDRGVPALLLHGGTPVAVRSELVDRFQAGEAPVFLLSLKAAGVGLNLTRADHVIHYDRWWNPAVEQQATDRAYRMGQTRPVQVHRLISEGTLEDRIAALLESKRELAESVLADGESVLTTLSDAELSALVRLEGR
ncbi:DEAD/DEAH box helicase [Couchioplanes azureus]|uniref:DEAD/DEAH box helicase n=1 Tax=Couchioplanes caeruleus TaxID=56438 RepID=UPI0019C8C95F|nr:DEAD/DEAH box helicase [Couchioplanes caeruleus]GGQ86044.1 helicase [Couchioplanes caeruleus subsp. azureus]